MYNKNMHEIVKFEHVAVASIYVAGFMASFSCQAWLWCSKR